ncbi:MAG: hypothetical protein R3190_15045 [Thermoanaerobaculia bacterium]|nr:hypothetical protein [Thermoanaerobaculia bacterium]
MRYRSATVATACAAVAVLLACEHRGTGALDPLEETASHAMKAQAEVAARQLRSARESVASRPDLAAADIEAAASSIDNLVTYYLPLLDAREKAYNAYGHLQNGEQGSARLDLERLEEILSAMARARPTAELEAIQPPLERAASARAALADDPEEAAAAIRFVAIRLNQLLTKGDLVLKSHG